MTKADRSLVSYYQQHRFNPVFIPVEDHDKWEIHFARRRNLYENHLNIPLSLLRGRSVIEFGCNSGENALVLGALGASLTLVEPNDQVLPRLRELFGLFKLEGSIRALHQESIESFQGDGPYDVVIAEGYLNILSTRERMLEKIGRLLGPGGIGIISFDDRYGSLVELVKRCLLWRACQLRGIEDILSPESLDVAVQFFGEDFGGIKASRTMESWWKDQLVSPFFCLPYLWTYREIIPLIENAGCVYYSSSPKWATTDHFQWYKNVMSFQERHAHVLDSWKNHLLFFLTGRHSEAQAISCPPDDALQSLDHLIEEISTCTRSYPSVDAPPSYPVVLDHYFDSTGDRHIQDLNGCLRTAFDILPFCGYEELLLRYKGMIGLRPLWGTPYHYVSFLKHP